MLNLVVFAASCHSAGRQVGRCLQAAKKANFILQHFPSLILLYWKLQQPQEHHHTYHTLTFIQSNQTTSCDEKSSLNLPELSCHVPSRWTHWNLGLRPGKEAVQNPQHVLGPAGAERPKQKGELQLFFLTVRAGPLDWFQCFLMAGWCI